MPFRFLLAGALVGLLIRHGFTDEPPRATLSAQGVHVMPVAAKRVRIAVPLFAHALTADEAIELLRRRKSDARERVLTLECENDSIRFVGVTVETNDTRKTNNYSALRRMNNGAENGLDPDDLPIIVTARVDLIADWILPDADQEALLGLAEHLVASLKEPDLTGISERPEFSPRVEEVLESMRSTTNVYTSRTSQQSQDEVRYAFVATVTPEMVRTGYEAAVADAKESIVAMAGATEMELDRLLTISSNQSYPNSSYSSSRGRKEVLTAEPGETLATQIGDLEYQVRVHMQYSVVQ